MDHRRGTEHLLYWTGIWLVLLMVVLYAAFVFLEQRFPQLRILGTCRMKETFHIPCPGCGGTRAVISFFKGQWGKSIYYNAFGFYGTALCSVFFLTQTLERITKGKVRGLRLHEWFWKVGIVLIVVQYFMKLCIPAYQV